MVDAYNNDLKDNSEGSVIMSNYRVVVALPRFRSQTLIYVEDFDIFL